MTEPRNPVTNPVTQPSVTGSVTPPHTTPHHTTPLSTGLSGSVSVRTPSPRETDQLSAAAITLVALRPDWRYDTTRQALATDPRAWRDVIAAGLACALDPQSHPALIATTTPARVVADHGPTPTPPSYAEVRRRQAALEDAS